jgi:hypothetical protein
MAFLLKSNDKVASRVLPGLFLGNFWDLLYAIVRNLSSTELFEIQTVLSRERQTQTIRVVVHSGGKRGQRCQGFWNTDGVTIRERGMFV